MSCVTTDMPQQSSRLGQAQRLKGHVPFPLLTRSRKLDVLDCYRDSVLLNEQLPITLSFLIQGT